ncbi:MAG: ATP-dependent Clp protease adaptor ClpS [Verrucomicrobiales bacterium]|nr:ATP-dependent Clp protease adaptor ClpS [Verrucomicrobiales bacterium]
MVWNDNINTQDFVVFVFRTVLHMDKNTATRHMLEVHEAGSSVVFSGNKERCEYYTVRIKDYGIKASLEQAS